MRTSIGIRVRDKAVGLIFLVFVTVAQAQKLPTIQTASVTAPKDIKIDGKPTEWPAFAAYNNAVQCFYIISNDIENLYLAIQATDHTGKSLLTF